MLQLPSHVHRRVLIVDDNQDAAETLSMFLDAVGQTTAVANNGNDGLRLAGQFAPEIVFLDLGMPGMDGYEVARALRQMPGMDHLVLIALTGWGDPDCRARTAAAGFDRHLTKPADFDAIQQILLSHH